METLHNNYYNPQLQKELIKELMNSSFVEGYLELTTIHGYNHDDAMEDLIGIFNLSEKYRKYLKQSVNDAVYIKENLDAIIDKMVI